MTVNGQVWPVMPQPDLNQSIASYPFWLEFNQGNPKLIDAMAGWITAGKAVDTPQAAALKQATLAAAPPKPFGFAKGSEFFPILFVASFSGDDGRRPGDGGVPAVPANYVPAHYWNSAQIFLTYPPGVAGHPAGTTASPAHLQPGEEYYVAVIVGNSGNQPAGRVAGSGGKMIVAAEAQAFNSGWGPATPALPALSNLDPAILASDYEQYHLRAPSYDVVGFRFNVDSVIAGLKAAIAAAQNINLGGMSVEEWLNDSHPCIKVLIKSGEPAGPYTPQANALPTFDSNPRTERHAAQRNLAPFLIPVMMAKKIGWKNFMVRADGRRVQPARDRPRPVAQHLPRLSRDADGDVRALCRQGPERRLRGGARGGRQAVPRRGDPAPDDSGRAAGGGRACQGGLPRPVAGHRLGAAADPPDGALPAGLAGALPAGRLDRRRLHPAAAGDAVSARRAIAARHRGRGNPRPR